MEFITKILFAFIVNGFGLVVFWSYRFFKIGKKDNEYSKVMETFGLKKKYEDIRGKKVERKPSTVMKTSNYLLPLAFYTITSSVLSAIFLFPTEFFEHLFMETKDAQGNIIETAKTFSHNPFFMGMYFGNLSIENTDFTQLTTHGLQRRSIATIAWGFMGAFLWASFNMVRRLSNADITPILYYKAAFRMLFACAIALIFSFISTEVNIFGTLQFNNAFIPGLAFMAGFLPERFFNYLMELMKSIFSGTDINNKELHLKHIGGLSVSHRERLWEEGIDNAQNLAQTSIIQLILKTPFEARQLLDWIGQAKLLCHMKDDIDKAHDVGIRSVFDLISLKETYTKKGKDNMNALQELGMASGLRTPILAVVAELVNEDVGAKSLKGFMDKLNGKKNVAILYENDEVDPNSIINDSSKPPVEIKNEEDLVKILDTPQDMPKDIPTSYD